MTTPNSILVNGNNNNVTETSLITQNQTGTFRGRGIIVHSSYANKANFRAGAGPGMFNGLLEGAGLCIIISVLAAAVLSAGIGVGIAKDWATGGMVLGAGGGIALVIIVIAACALFCKKHR